MLKSHVTKDHLVETISFEEVVEQAQIREKELSNKKQNMDESEIQNLNYLKLNNHRIQRVLKTYSISPELQNKINQIKSPQTWLVISEDWCGDSSQSLPIIAKIAEVNPLISLRILTRDDHLDLMDRYLTNGNRSIPKLIAIDENLNELFQWGPRPQTAADIFKKARESGLGKDDAYKEMHTWYARDKGKSIEAEFVNILSHLVSKMETALVS